MELVKKLFAAGLLSLAVLAAGCEKNPVTGEKEVALISEQDEIAIGASSAPEFEKEFGGKVDNARLQDYVSSIGRKVSAVSDRPMPYEFALLNSDVPNAFALPGGKVYVTAGLFANMGNERQLAAVLGHEVTHVAAKHSVNALQRQMGASVLAELVGAAVGGEGAASAKAAAELATNLANLRYSRDDESQADAVGIRYMEKAGYNPWGMVEMLEGLDKLSQTQPGLFGDFFDTHPLTSTRIRDARGIVTGKYGTYSASTSDPQESRFREMRALLPSAVK